jgi:hypothetical protein
MQTQPAIPPLTGPGTGRLKLSAYGSQAYSSRIPYALLSRIGDIQMPSPRGNRTQPASKLLQKRSSHPNST